MLTRFAAQGLTDILAAAALGACVIAALRRGVRSPLSLRIVFAFGGLALFFVCRGAAEVSKNSALAALVEVLVAALPIAGLVLTEGLLRRHAPKALKAAIAVGALALMLALILVGVRPPVSSWGLGGYISLSLLALVVLLISRDQSSLSHQENASIDGVMVAGVGFMALVLTDFLPAAPIGMSGLGASFLARLMRNNATSSKGVWRAVRELFLIAAAAIAFTAAVTEAVALKDANEAIRLGAVVMTLMIALVTLIDALQEHGGRDDALALRKALALSDTSSLAAFLDGLVGQPLLKGLRLMEDDRLAEYDTDVLVKTFSGHAVWTRKMLRDAVEPHGLGHEELLDLMLSADANHAALISATPLRIALLTFPEMGPADGAETDLSLFCKLARVAAEARV